MGKEEHRQGWPEVVEHRRSKEKRGGRHSVEQWPGSPARLQHVRPRHMAMLVGVFP